MSGLNSTLDVFDIPPIETRADEAHTFATYRNYLLSLSAFIKAEYGDDPSCFPAMQSRCLMHEVEKPSRNLKLTGADEDSIRKSLFNSWHTEIVLSLPASTPDLIRYANHWSPVQAYYSVYLSLRAYFKSSGNDAAETHAASLKTISSQLEQRNLMLPFWNVTCTGGSGATLKHFHYRNLPSGHTVRNINSISTPRIDDFWDWLAMLLRTTRSREVKSKLEDRNTKKNHPTKSGNPRQKYTADQRVKVCAGLPATSIFHFLYRLRIRSNYEDADAFLLGNSNDYDGRLFHSALALITSCTLFNLERLTAHRLGRARMDEIADTFLSADKYERASKTVSVRRQFWF